jgi:hypothetical protein
MDGSGYIAERDPIDHDTGCAYVLEEANGRWRACGAQRRRLSSYCAHHHAVCYITSGSNEELKLLRVVEALASAVGGRRTRQQAEPTRQFLKRLEKAVRGAS